MVEGSITTINTNEYYRTHPEWDRFVTRVATGNGILHSDIPEADFKKLLDIYKRTPHEEKIVYPVHFVLKIDSRIYAEWCMSPTEGGRNWNLHRNYKGEGFKTFVDDETHHAIKRLQELDILGPDYSNAAYLGVRGKVLEGLVKRAVELFSEWDNNTHPLDAFDDNIPIDKKDKRNLRASLEKYIGF